MKSFIVSFNFKFDWLSESPLSFVPVFKVDIILVLEPSSNPISFSVFNSILIPLTSTDNILSLKFPKLSGFSSVVNLLEEVVVFESPFIKSSSIALNEFNEK